MRGQKNIKLCNADLAKRVYQYKNIKIKLCKNNAAIWYNKTCRTRQLTPTYANINIKGTNSRCQRTKKAVICFRINQDLKFQYAKKQLNERLYKLHLECVTLWPTTWHFIQSTIDSNIQQQMDNHNNCLNKKLDQLVQKQLKLPTHPQHNEDCHFYTRVLKLMNVKFNKVEMQLLKYGLNYSIEKAASTYAANLIAEAE